MAARDVNGSGDIVGQASGPDGYLHAVSIKPFADTNRDGAISVADLFTNISMTGLRRSGRHAR